MRWAHGDSEFVIVDIRYDVESPHWVLDKLFTLPGVVRDLRVKSRGADWFVLDWKPPNNGGTPAAYHVERRRRDGGEWEFCNRRLVL